MFRKMGSVENLEKYFKPNNIDNNISQHFTSLAHKKR